MTDQMLLERTQETMRYATTERAGGRPPVVMSSPGPAAKAVLAPPAPLPPCSFCPSPAPVAYRCADGLTITYCGDHAVKLLGTLPAEKLDAMERESR